MDNDNRETVFFSGYAKLPSGITATEMYKIIGVVVIINLQTEHIIDADCTLATEAGRTFVKNLLVGYSMAGGVEGLLRSIDMRYQGSAKRAIITALKIINDKYRSYKDGYSISALD